MELSTLFCALQRRQRSRSLDDPWPWSGCINRRSGAREANSFTDTVEFRRVLLGF